VAIYWGNILFPIHRDWDKIIENILFPIHRDWDKIIENILFPIHRDWSKIRRNNLLKFQKIGKNFSNLRSIIFSLLFAINCSPKAPTFFILFSKFLLILY